MSGKRAYGGHEMNENEISLRLAGSKNTGNGESSSKGLSGIKSDTSISHKVSFESERSPQPGNNVFLEQMLRSLMENKTLPKFQFERRIDAVISLFIPGILSQRYGGNVRHVVPEFPIKKEVNNQSRNADYLLFQSGGIPESGSWIMAELKTDDNSVETEQLELYKSALVRGMEQMLNDIMLIRNATKMAAKYDALLKRLDGLPAELPLKIVYFLLTDNDVSYLQKEYPEIDFIDKKELMDYVPDTFAKEWKMFKDIVLNG